MNVIEPRYPKNSYVIVLVVCDAYLLFASAVSTGRPRGAGNENPAWFLCLLTHLKNP
jgi:hypothetical protein